MNLARVYNAEGRLDDAVAALQRADQFKEDEGFPRWTWAWLSGAVNRQQGRLEEAERNLRSALDDESEETRRRKFDFSQDYIVRNLLGQTLFDLGEQRSRQGQTDDARHYWNQAIVEFQKALKIDPENVSAHRNLQSLYARTGDEEKSEAHRELHCTL